MFSAFYKRKTEVKRIFLTLKRQLKNASYQVSLFLRKASEIFIRRAFSYIKHIEVTGFLCIVITMSRGGCFLAKVTSPASAKNNNEFNNS